MNMKIMKTSAFLQISKSNVEFAYVSIRSCYVCSQSRELWRTASARDSKFRTTFTAIIISPLCTSQPTLCPGTKKKKENEPIASDAIRLFFYFSDKEMARNNRTKKKINSPKPISARKSLESYIYKVLYIYVNVACCMLSF